MSTPQCSLLIYLQKDSALLAEFFQNLRSFFAKFPMTYEVVCIVENKSYSCLETLTEIAEKAPDKEDIVLIENDRTLGRAKSLLRSMEEARSPFILLLSPEMATPFGDIFKLMQHLITEEVDICWGDRYKKLDSPFTKAPHARHRTEIIFNKIFKEKFHDGLEDPLCEFIAIKKSSWEKIKPSLYTERLTGWYLGPLLYKKAKELKLNIIELPVYDSGMTSPSYHLWSERWNLLKQGLFR